MPPPPVRFKAALLPVTSLVILAWLCAACQALPGKPVLPTTVGQPASALAATPRPSASVRAVVTPAPSRTALPAPATATATPFLVVQPAPDARRHPTLADFWAGQAHFVVDVPDTQLPMGESDTIVMGNGELWSYVHASARSAGTVDRCGDPVAFPGCTVIYRSYDRGISFRRGQPPICQFSCQTCPCTNEEDQIEQQQYPRVFYDGRKLYIAYEFQGRVMVRTSQDGLQWSSPRQVDGTLIWHLWYRDCPSAERIGLHPFVPFDYECLAGGPPGLYVEDDRVYVFLALGQNPGAMGCYVAPLGEEIGRFERCARNPLFVGADRYGPSNVKDATANVHFDFRTVSSAEVVKLGEGEDARYYMFYEGVRGPGPGDPGDSQFGLGLARSMTSRIDGPWEKYPGNPILVDLPGNIGLGHADVVVLGGRTYLYTSLDGVARSRLRLVWDS
jgi:hypothetical protein